MLGLIYDVKTGIPILTEVFPSGSSLNFRCSAEGVEPVPLVLKNKDSKDSSHVTFPRAIAPGFASRR